MSASTAGPPVGAARTRRMPTGTDWLAIRNRRAGRTDATAPSRPRSAACLRRQARGEAGHGVREPLRGLEVVRPLEPRGRAACPARPRAHSLAARPCRGIDGASRIGDVEGDDVRAAPCPPGSLTASAGDGQDRQREERPHDGPHHGARAVRTATDVPPRRSVTLSPLEVPDASKGIRERPAGPCGRGSGTAPGEGERGVAHRLRAVSAGDPSDAAPSCASAGSGPYHPFVTGATGSDGRRLPGGRVMLSLPDARSSGRPAREVRRVWVCSTGERALIFGVANDHSIAWGIAKALHRRGRRRSASRRSRPSWSDASDRWPNRSVRRSSSRATSRRTRTSTRVFELWKEREGRLDVLVHAVAFAKREELGGRVHPDLARGLPARPRRLGLLARRARPRGASADERRRRDPDADVLRGREGRAQLQRHGRRQGVPGGLRPLPRRATWARTASASTR